MGLLGRCGWNSAADFPSAYDACSKCEKGPVGGRKESDRKMEVELHGREVSRNCQ